MSESMKPEYTLVPYGEMDFVWESNRWDVPLSGLCIHGGKLCSFSVGDDCFTDDPESDFIVTHYRVAPLSFIERMRWRFRKAAFEVCVGRHCSYPERTRGARFYYKWPRWFWKLVFNAYYAIRKNRK